jgi:tetratricopeptide (TPR) repeat protein
VVSAQALDFHGGFVMIGGGLSGLSDGAIAIAILDIANQLHAVGRDDQALELIHQMREVPGHEAMSKFFVLGIDDLEGDIMVSRGDLKAARVLNDRAFAALGPAPPAFHSAGLHASRAEIFEREGDLRGAEREYRVALAGQGSNVEVTQPVYLSLARCLDKLGEREAARTILERELARPVAEPRTAPPAWLLLAELRWQAGLHATAIEAATMASATVSKLPAVVAVRSEIDHWLATHPRDVVAGH